MYLSIQRKAAFIPHASVWVFRRKFIKHRAKNTPASISGGWHWLPFGSRLVLTKSVDETGGLSMQIF